MSINKFVFDAQTGKLTEAEAYSETLAIKAVKIKKSRFNWQDFWTNPMSVWMLITTAVISTTAAISKTNLQSSLFYILGCIGVLGLMLIESRSDKPSITLKYCEASMPEKILDIEDTINIAVDSHYYAGLLARNPFQSTLTIYFEHKYFTKPNLYQGYEGMLEQASSYEPFIVRSQEAVPDSIADKLKIAQAGFESLQTRLPLEVYDSVYCYDLLCLKNVTLRPEIVDWLESIVEVFKR